MFSTGFSMDTERMAEPFDGPSAQFLVAQATRRGVWVCGSAPEVQPGDSLPSNTLLLAAPDGGLTRYRKIHPFSYGGEDEKYAAGTERVTVEVEGVRCSLFVCYDLRFADEFWAVAATPTATWSSPTGPHRAVTTGAPCCGPGRSRTRRSSSASTAWEVAAGSTTRATARSCCRSGARWRHRTAAREEILLHDVTADEVADVRAKYPFLDDRR